jgi:hypothetical protein
MHLDYRPFAAAFFERARPAAIIPAGGLTVPLGMVIEETGKPRGVSQFRELQA